MEARLWGKNSTIKTGDWISPMQRAGSRMLSAVGRTIWGGPLGLFLKLNRPILGPECEACKPGPAKRLVSADGSTNGQYSQGDVTVQTMFGSSLKSCSTKLNEAQ